jgi:uncharacterized membrane protein YeaQ/YmgE (transglycosylase-associated protein family)
VSNLLWIILIGFIAGIIARLVSPGPNNPSGFILTTVLGIAGAFISTFIGQTIGWYRLDQGAGLIGATIGAIVVLFIWNRLVAHRVLSDPGNPTNVPSTRRWL